MHTKKKKKEKSSRSGSKNRCHGVWRKGLFHLPALLECCPFLETAPHSRPAAKHTRPIGEPSKHSYQGLGWSVDVTSYINMSSICPPLDRCVAIILKRMAALGAKDQMRGIQNTFDIILLRCESILKETNELSTPYTMYTLSQRRNEWTPKTKAFLSCLSRRCWEWQQHGIVSPRIQREQCHLTHRANATKYLYLHSVYITTWNHHPGSLLLFRHRFYWLNAPLLCSRLHFMRKILVWVFLQTILQTILIVAMLLKGSEHFF